MENKNYLYDVKKHNNIKELVEDAIKEFGDKTAFIEKIKKEDKSVTYRNISFNEFKEETDALGAYLISLGLKNKKIAILSQNRYEWMSVYFAVVNGVGIVVPLDRSLPADEAARRESRR